MRFSPFRRDRHVSRGQALVELAVILPILLLLFLLAVDVGRVFFGWVSLNNGTRIGANEAAKNPTTWSLGVADDLYYTRMAQDLQALNCGIPDYDGDNKTNETDGMAELVQDLKAAPAPAVQPEFLDNADTADVYEVGDLVSVELECEFSFVTPLVGGILGDPLTISATSTFAVFGGEIAGVPIPPDPVPAGCIGTDKEVPSLVGMTVANARTAWTAAGFTGAFIPSTGSDDNTVLTQLTAPVASPGECLLYLASVTVTHKVPDTCDPSTEGTIPNLVGMTVAEARSTWTGTGFLGGFIPLTGSDADEVTAQDTLPVSTPGECALLTTQVNVTHSAPPPSGGQCTMVQVLGNTPAQALSAYQGEGFTGVFTTTPANKPTWKVKSQSLIGGQDYACTASLEVALENK
jgi:hypothetical protein